MLSFMLSRISSRLLLSGRCFASKPKHYDLISVGAGSAGLFTALKAKKFGKNICVIDRHRLGGRCVHAGCIPKKIIYHATMIREDMSYGPQYGVTFENPKIDWLKIKGLRDRFTFSMHVDYVDDCKKAGIEFKEGKAKLVGPNEVEVLNEEKNEVKKLTADHILIATGSRPLMPRSIKGIEYCVNSDSLFALETLPKRIFIIGGGYIGTELACSLRAFGVKITICTQDDRLVVPFDTEITNTLRHIMEGNGIQVIVNSVVKKVERTCSGGYQVTYEGGKPVVVDTVICAAGIKANTEGLGLEEIGVKLNRNGTVVVDDYENTSVKGIYAVGDVTGKVVLTPVAKEAGARLAIRLFGGNPNSKLDYSLVPSVAFTHPPIGKVGLTEEEAINKYGKENIKIYRAKFIDLFYKVTNANLPTIFKLVCKLPDEKIIGIHTIGRNIDEMMQGHAVTVTVGATKKDYDNTISIHPTASEYFVTMGEYH